MKNKTKVSQMKNNEIKKLETFGERMKASRIAAGLTQAQLAEQIGAGIATPTRWENNASLPDFGSLTKVIAVFKASIPGYSADVLFGA